MDDEILKGFVTLFRGRGDAYGSWEGGCVRSPLTPDHFKNHLATGPFIGVYPCLSHNGQTQCVWGCTDIDYHGEVAGNPDEAWMIHDALQAVGVPSWVEKTKRGYHVWVFATELLLAGDMRRMFLAAHQVTGLNPKEVNPKQEKLANGQLGNYVRLPYPDYGNGVRYMIDRKGNKISLSEFVPEAIATRVTPTKVAEIADYYQPPKVATITVGAPSHDMAQAARQLTPLGRAIFRDGPIEGRDRSTTLTHLAHECRKASLNPEDAMSILEDADLRWGKYLIRGEVGRLELEKLLVRAYGHTQSS